MSSFQRLVRFVQGDLVHYGDLIDSTGGEFTIRKLRGSPFEKLEQTDDIIKTGKLLCPIDRTPLIICIGLNYRSHAQEAKLAIPTQPAVFTKPPDALSGPSNIIYTHPDTRSMLDYEDELVVVIGKDAKNVSEEDASEYILGYAAGNDVSARNFQLPDVSGGQFCYAKSFDGFAPIGPAIVSPTQFANPTAIRVTTTVNGSIKQDSNTSDMIFKVNQIISHLSRGTTLRQGTVIMTGTPSGVGYFRKEFLQDGDVIEVEIHGIGKIQNRVSFSD